MIAKVRPTDDGIRIAFAQRKYHELNVNRRRFLFKLFERLEISSWSKDKTSLFSKINETRTVLASSYKR